MSEPVSLQVFDISASALTAERMRIAVIAQNIANAEVTGRAGADPYRRRRVSFESVLKQEVGRRKDGLPVGAVRARIEEVPGEFRIERIKGHASADANGDVKFPNVSVIEEMVQLIDASRTYEANLSALRTWKQMLGQTLEMTR